MPEAITSPLGALLTGKNLVDTVSQQCYLGTLRMGAAWRARTDLEVFFFFLGIYKQAVSEISDLDANR